MGDQRRLEETVGDYIVINALQIAGYYVIHIASHYLRHLDPPYMCHYPKSCRNFFIPINVTLFLALHQMVFDVLTPITTGPVSSESEY